MKATLETRLAYVVTGDAEVDRISQGRPAGPHAVPGAAHRARSRRAGRARSRPRRARLLSADLLADRAERAEAFARGAGTHRRLHEAGRHGAVRHPRRDRGAARPRRRDPLARHAGAAQHPLLARHSRARAGAARSRADQDVLPAEGLPRPLRHRPALGRGDADRERGRAAQPPGARRRRRLLDHHHVERSRRRLGDAAGRPGHAADRRPASRASANSPSAPASTS